MPPISKQAFNDQVDSLLREHGPSAFAASDGNSPSFTLFVDGETVVAEPQESPRHRYGTYCSLAQVTSFDSIEALVYQWLESGEAYNSYIGMHVPL